MGAETAQKVKDPSSVPSNQLIERAAKRAKQKKRPRGDPKKKKKPVPVREEL